MEKIKHEQRVEIKKRAKDVVRSHFILLVIICLVVSYYGTDLNFVTDNVDTLWKLVTGQPIEFGDDSLKIDKSKTSDKVLQDLIDDNYKAGKTHAAIQLEEYRQENRSGRRKCPGVCFAFPGCRSFLFNCLGQESFWQYYN